MRITTTTWLESRALPSNRPKERLDVTVDGREGLMVRVFPSGAVTFRFRYTFGGERQPPMTFGRFGKGALSLADAFDTHQRAPKELTQGLDPKEEAAKREEAAAAARSERASAGSLAEVIEQVVHRKLRAERWDRERGAWVRDEKVKTKARKRPDAAAGMLGCTRPDAPTPRRKRKVERVPTLLSEFGQYKARDITRRQLIEFFDEIVDRGGPVYANRIYALAKQLFTWAASKDLIPASAMAGIERPGGDESARKRVLSEDEIKAFWAKTDSAETARPTKIALKLLLVTAQRRGELTAAKWAHFDLPAKHWTIPWISSRRATRSA